MTWCIIDLECQFQHTAARRRLGQKRPNSFKTKFVSTHSRPKAAGKDLGYGDIEIIVSTHSRPKAAGSSRQARASANPFQHTAARRRLVLQKNN